MISTRRNFGSSEFAIVHPAKSQPTRQIFCFWVLAAMCGEGELGFRVHFRNTIENHAADQTGNPNDAARTRSAFQDA
jgi:hypothetical protein